MKKYQKSKTLWHCLLGKLLQELLAPVGISVFTELPVMSKPPKADILLMRKQKSGWSPEQMARLPDGVRESKARHILLEFKYTESVDEDAVTQTLCYDYLYRETQKLKAHEIQTFLISSKTPRKSTLERIEYFHTDQKGVCRSNNYLIKPIPMLCLNELPDEAHNAFVKLFASHRKVKKSAFGTLEQQGLSSFGRQLQLVVEGLISFWFVMKGDDMKAELTPERLMEFGKFFEKAVLPGLPLEERLAGLKPEERLAGLKPEERLAGLKPEERLAGLKPEDILAELSVKEIEAYLKKLKKKR